MFRSASSRTTLILLAVAAPILAVPAGAQCSDADSDGYYYETGCGTARDCNDDASSTYPGAVEPCDGFDNDCDGQVDDDAACDRTCDLPGSLGSAVPITDTPDASQGPAFAWTGTEYGVVWSEGFYEIVLARTDPSGSKIGNDMPTGLSTHYSGLPYLVWTGSGFGMVYSYYVEPPGGGNWVSKAFFHRFDAQGNMVGTQVQVNDETWISATNPRLVWTGSQYGVVWYDHRDGWPWYPEAYFARLDAAGNKIGPDVRLSTGEQSSWPSDLVWTGEEYAVVYTDERHSNDGYSREVYFARIDAAGNPTGGEIRITTQPEHASGAKLAWSGTEYGLAWNDSRDGNNEIYFARLDAGGNKIGSDVRITDTPESSGLSSLVWNGEEYGLAWSETRDGNEEIYFARLDAAGNKLGGDVRVTFHAGLSRSASLLWDGIGYGVILRDGRNEGVLEIYFTRIGCSAIDGDGDGAPSAIDCDDANGEISPAGAQICDDGINNNCNHPSWPDLTGTNETDDDSDGPSECAGDCDDTNPAAWSPPGPVRNFRYDAWNLVSWDPPLDAGGTADLLYDVISAYDIADFGAAPWYCNCVNYDEMETWSYESHMPYQGEPVLYYVARAINACPEGEGSIGHDSAGAERPCTMICP